MSVNGTKKDKIATTFGPQGFDIDRKQTYSNFMKTA